MSNPESENVTAEIQMLMQAGFIVNELKSDSVDETDEQYCSRVLELIDNRLKDANSELRRLWIEHRNFVNAMNAIRGGASGETDEDGNDIIGNIPF